MRTAYRNAQQRDRITAGQLEDRSPACCLRSHMCCSHVRIADDACEVTAPALEGHTPCVPSARELGGARGLAREPGVSKESRVSVTAEVPAAASLALAA